jgi:CRP/FNR family transcriptional regulator, cyclic AMP receptor protein
MPSSSGNSADLRQMLDSLPFAQLRIEAQEPIYATGDQDDAMYVIESGQVKLVMSSAGGNDCLLAVYAAGDVFGETCLDGSARRVESASAMSATIVRRVSRRDVMAEVERANASTVLLAHLARRLVDRQTAVFDLITMDAAPRLAKALLQIAEKLGESDGMYLRIEQRISHEELSQIVGTTRPRITAFMQQFRRDGLVDTAGSRVIRVHRERVLDYLARD